MRRQSITSTANGFDHLASSHTKSFPQAFDMNIDSALFNEDMVSPNFVQ
jgi:hypothetical protein